MARTAPEVPADLAAVSDGDLAALDLELAEVRLDLREQHIAVIRERDKRIEAARAKARVAAMSDTERAALAQELAAVGGIDGSED